MQRTHFFPRVYFDWQTVQRLNKTKHRKASCDLLIYSRKKHDTSALFAALALSFCALRGSTGWNFNKSSGKSLPRRGQRGTKKNKTHSSISHFNHPISYLEEQNATCCFFFLNIMLNLTSKKWKLVSCYHTRLTTRWWLFPNSCW